MESFAAVIRLSFCPSCLIEEVDTVGVNSIIAPFIFVGSWEITGPGTTSGEIGGSSVFGDTGNDSGNGFSAPDEAVFISNSGMDIDCGLDGSFLLRSAAIAFAEGRGDDLGEGSFPVLLDLKLGFRRLFSVELDNRFGVRAKFGVGGMVPVGDGRSYPIAFASPLISAK